MSDLLEVLPDFDIKPYTHLIHSLEKNDITVTDLLSLDTREIVRQCPLPLNDLSRFVQSIIKNLRDDIKHDLNESLLENRVVENEEVGNVDRASTSHTRQKYLVKTLDSTIDTALGGGFYPGHITEIVGESAVGKTQLVLGLLLSVQLLPPNGLGKSAIYLSTESPLSTERLYQFLESNPIYQSLTTADRPSLNNIHTLSIHDLQSQYHVIEYQLAIAIKKFNVGLIVMDSVTANFRAEHETKSVTGLADRSTDLIRLGMKLREIAIENEVVVVVTNQISDRFDDVLNSSNNDSFQSSSPYISASPSNSQSDDTFSFNHQQRFFTGWGEQKNFTTGMKTPALGMIWANQISVRIVLKMNFQKRQENSNSNLWTDAEKKRSLAVVFAPWTKPTYQPIKYKILGQGIVSILDDDLEQDVENLDFTIEALDEKDAEFP